MVITCLLALSVNFGCSKSVDQTSTQDVVVGQDVEDVNLSDAVTQTEDVTPVVATDVLSCDTTDKDTNVCVD